MQKAMVKKQLIHKPNKPAKPKAKTQDWRKNVDWSAAGHKAYLTRMKNLKRNEKAGNVKRTSGNAEAPQQKIRK